MEQMSTDEVMYGLGTFYFPSDPLVAPYPIQDECQRWLTEPREDEGGV